MRADRGSLWKSLTICILVIGWARDARARRERGERESDVRHRALGACVCIHVGELLNKREPLERGGRGEGVSRDRRTCIRLIFR